LATRGIKNFGVKMYNIKDIEFLKAEIEESTTFVLELDSVVGVVSGIAVAIPGQNRTKEKETKNLQKQIEKVEIQLNKMNPNKTPKAVINKKKQETQELKAKLEIAQIPQTKNTFHFKYREIDGLEYTLETKDIIHYLTEAEDYINKTAARKFLEQSSKLESLDKNSWEYIFCETEKEIALIYLED
jgi:hypothetical protein